MTEPVRVPARTRHLQEVIRLSREAALTSPKV